MGDSQLDHSIYKLDFSSNLTFREPTKEKTRYNVIQNGNVLIHPSIHPVSQPSLHPSIHIHINIDTMPTYTNKHMFHDIHIHITTSHTSILPHTQTQSRSCIHGNSTTISIPRNQDRNDRNPPTFSIRFLHTICRNLEIPHIHY